MKLLSIITRFQIQLQILILDSLITLSSEITVKMKQKIRTAF